MKLKYLALNFLLLSTLASAGNEGGGGGNIPIELTAKAEDFKNFILGPNGDSKTLRSDLRSMFMGLQTSEKALELNLSKKLFPSDSSQSVISLISKVEIKINNKSGCIDPLTGEERDGSADKATNEICFSIHRLKNRLLRQTAYAQLLRLAAHEVSHLSGLNEMEATVLETKFSLADVESPDSIKNLKNTLLSEAGNIVNSASKLEELLTNTKKNQSQICEELVQIHDSRGSLRHLLNLSDKNGIALTSTKNAEKLKRELNTLAETSLAEKCTQISKLKESLQKEAKKQKTFYLSIDILK